MDFNTQGQIARILRGVVLIASCALLLGQVGRDLDLTVQVVDRQGNPIGGALVRRSGDSIVDSQEEWVATNSSGFATWKVRNIRTRIGISAKAEGFLPDGTQVWTSPTDRKIEPVVIRLRSVPGVMATVVVTDASGPVAGAYVQFLGKGLLGSTYSGSSAGDGTAKVFVQAAGAYDVKVTEERHEAWAGEVNIRMGMQPPEIPALLERKKDKSTGTERLSSRIVVTVTSGGRPIRGAEVSASGSEAGKTDARGRVTLTGTAAIGDQLEVSASAPGYKAGRGSALMQVEGNGLGSARYAGGSVTIQLVAGEDELPGDTPIRLLIVLRDAGPTNELVTGIPITLRFENGTKVQDTAAEDGSALFTIRDSPRAPLEMVRRGIRVEIEPTKGYKKVLDTVPPALLMPRLSTTEYEVRLERDLGPGLRSMLQEMKGKVSKLRGAHSLYELSKTQLATDDNAVRSALTTAEAILKAVQATGAVLDPVAQKCAGRVAPGERPPAEMSRSLAKAKDDADQLLTAFNLNLNQADRLVQRCGAGDGAQAKQKHLEATQLMLKLGVLDKQAEAISTEARRFALQSQNAREVFAQAAARLHGFDTLIATAKKANESAPATVQAAQAAYAEGSVLEKTIPPSLEALQGEYQRASRGGTDPSLADVGKELEALLKTVRSGRSSFAGERPVLLPGYAKSIASNLQNIQQAQLGVITFLEDRKICTVAADDSARKEVAAAFQEAQTMIITFADLPKQADECVLRSGPCAGDGQDIRQLLADGGIDEAQRRIGAAKTRGCNVADLERDFESYKLIRDAAVYIEALNAACRFQDAVNRASQLPPMATSSKIVRDAIYRANEGLAAQPKVAAALGAARQAAQAGNAAETERNLKRAELESRTIPCLLTQVTQAGAELRSSARTTTSVPAQKGGPLVGKFTMGSQDKRYENRHGSGRLAGETMQSYTPSTIRFERNEYDDKGGRTHRVVIEWNYGGLPSSLSPGQTVTLTVSGGFKEVFPAGSADGYVFSGVVYVGGDVDVQSAQQMDRGHPEGKYIFRVRPNARNVEVHFGSAPAGTGAMWKFTNQ